MRGPKDTDGVNGYVRFYPATLGGPLMKKLLPKKGAFAASRCNRQKLSRTLIILAAILLLLGLSSPSSAQQGRRIPGQRPLQTAAVAGTIRDQDGRPVPGVVVEFRSRTSQRKFSAIASSEGIYRLNSLPAGDYDVTVAGTGFAPSSANLTPAARTIAGSGSAVAICCFWPRHDQGTVGTTRAFRARRHQRQRRKQGYIPGCAGLSRK